MKTYRNIYPKLCSYKNLERAFRKARKGKSSKHYVKNFEKDLSENLLEIKRELETFTYEPMPLKKFIIHDPKTRVIRKSIFKDRVVHHSIINILEPLFEKTFIYDSYANRLDKGTTTALKRFDEFKRKVSQNGRLVANANNENMIKGYCLKADIKHFFDSVNQEILLDIIKKKVKDPRVIWLVKRVINNFDNKEKGMPLGNMTSQFFANVYLNKLDYFIKHRLKMKYYLRYVDDFVILHKDKEVLEDCKDKINKYLQYLKLELHPDKSKVFPLYEGVGLLGFKIFYYHKLVRKRNVKQFKNNVNKLNEQYKNKDIDLDKALASIEGWFAYAKWGDSYKLRKNLIREIKHKFNLNEDEIKKLL